MILRPMPTVKTGGASSGTANAVSNIYVTVESIDDVKKIAHCHDQVGAARDISLVHMVGKVSGYPQAGEQWLVSSLFGHWMFVAQVDQIFPDNSGWVSLTSGQVTMLNSSIFASVSVRKTGSTVYITGNFTAGNYTTNASGIVSTPRVMTLPTPYTPTQTQSLVVALPTAIGAVEPNWTLGRFNIDTTGTVNLIGYTPSYTVVNGDVLAFSGSYVV